MIIFKKNHHFESLALWLIFLFTSIIIFGQGLNNFFVSDDFHWLTIARDISLSGQIFLTNYAGDHQGGSYNPLLVLIFKFFYSIFHNNYFGYHLISLILHASNAFLVYILAKQIFTIVSIKSFKKLSILVASLFLFYPIHVEVISWIAAWPHLFVTFFYLLSLINYFSFKTTNSIKKLVYSLVFFILALFIKEIAISLPLVILIWEVYFYTPSLSPSQLGRDIRKNSGGIYYYLPIYFIILALFLWLRYFSIGLIFGYYANPTLNFAYLDWIANLIVFFGDFFSFGFLRTIIYKAVYHYTDLVVIIILVSLAFYFFLTLIKQKYLQIISLISLLFVLAPVLVTGLHRTTFGGERYLYLPSIFFILWLVILLRDIKINFKVNGEAREGGLGQKINKYVLILIFLLFLTINLYKLSIWQEASSLSYQIVNSYQNLDIKNNQKLLSIALPDNLSGAEVFRNNLEQALEIYYPDNHPNIITTFAYIEVNKQNKNKQLLKWRQDERGWFAESIDGSFIVTGITSITKDNVYWELWNYNYQNYKANIIRLLPERKILEQIKKGDLEIIIFDRGILRILNIRDE